MTYKIESSYGVWSIKPGVTVIGRDENCDIILNDTRLSRRHLQFFLEDESLFVQDFGSRNGVLLNGEHLLEKSKVVGEDVIIAGPCLFKVISDASDYEDSDEVSLKFGKTDNSNEKENLKLEKELDVGEDSPTTNAEDDVFETDQSSTRLEEKKLEPKTENVEGDIGSNPALTSRSDDDSMYSRMETEEMIESDIFPQDTFPETSREEKEKIALTARKTNEAPSTSKRVNPDINKEISKQQTAVVVNNKKDESILGSYEVELEKVCEVKKSSRIMAAFLDSLSFALIFAFTVLPLYTIGFVTALLKAGATIKNNIPTIDVLSDKKATTFELVETLFNTETWANTFVIISEIRESSNTAFLIFFLVIVFVVIVILFEFILYTVASTTTKGAPIWHRKFDLRIVEQKNEYFPTPMRAFSRWALFVVFAPITVITILLGMPSLHDTITNCRVYKK